MYTPLPKLPKISRRADDIAALKPVPYLGIDLEWDIKTEVPTILGLSDGAKTVSVPFGEGRQAFQALLRRYPKAVIVGHNFLSSDLQVFAGMGIHIDPSQVQDTILHYWLTNMHLCKSSKKDDDEAERRGVGFMNLWTMLSLYTDLSNYKNCREDACEGPCPEHDVFGYNGLDALGPVLALPKMLKQATFMGVDKLYPLHRKLSLILYEMRQTGILIDRAYVAKLRNNFDTAKDILYDKETETGCLPFNPDSPKQVREFFSAHKISLKNTREETIKNACEKHGIGDLESDDPAIGEGERALLSLRDWKALGDGPDRWFKPRTWNSRKNEWEGYVHEDGCVRPHLGIFTSTARFQCTSPNMQNVPARRRDIVTGEKMKKVIRRAIIAPEGYYLAKFDYSNAENRVFLRLAGYRIPEGVDLHEWVRQIAKINEDSDFARSLGGARDAAKSIQHAGNYLEGLVLLWPNELRDFRIRTEIAAGARLVYPNWTFQGKIVTFTGANLARRAFGDASWENRRKALQIAEQYFGNFPKVRELQQRITKQIESENMVRPPNGYVLRSYGYSEDRLKTGMACWGSQPVAHYTKLAICNLWQVKERCRPILQVHDEILTIVPKRFPPAYIKKLLIEAAEIEVPEIKNLRLPVEVEYGQTWGDTKEVG